MKTIAHKIWLLLDSSKPGGIETHTLQLAEGLTQHNNEVQVVFLSNYGEHPLKNALANRNIPTITLDGKLSTLWKTIHQLEPKLIHTHGYKAGIYGRMLAKINKIPAVSTYHSGEVTSGKLAVYDWIDRISAGLADQVFAVSSQIALRLPVKAKLADNFVSTDKIKTSNGKQIAFVGRLSEEKGPDRFVQLAQKYPQNKFHFYGEGPMAETLINSAPNNVYFHGLQLDMSTVWPSIGLLVMPSRYEGLPMAALEAMAHGIPLLATRVGAFDELINKTSGGWLVNSGNATELEQGLKHWLDLNGDEKQQLKLSTKKAIEQRFSARVAIPKLIECYSQIIMSHQA